MTDLKQRLDEMVREEEASGEPTRDLEVCPGCGGPADNGHDRCLPPNPYFCSKCSDPKAPPRDEPDVAPSPQPEKTEE